MIVDVPCTLQEYYHGCVKMIVYKRQVLALDGHTLKEEEVVKSVVVKPGQAAGNTLRYKSEGNEGARGEKTDLIITLTAAKEEGDRSDVVKSTRRNGKDLIYTAKISLKQALRAEPVTVETLDGRLIRVPVDHIINP